MSRVIQVFNPVHGQKIKRTRLNVMGKILQATIRDVSIYIDKKLLRRVRISQSGMFEYRLQLQGLNLGKHDLEIRVQAGHRTERLQISFYIEAPDEEVETAGITPLPVPQVG